MCDTDLFQKVLQTWTNSKTGTLTSVAVNIAAGKQDTDAQIVVFRFSNLTSLVGPAYVSPRPIPPLTTSHTSQHHTT